MNDMNGKIIPEGWVREFLERDASGITGNLDRLCKETSSDIFFDKKVDHHYEGWITSWWNGESEGNWIDGFIRLAFALGDLSMIRRSEEYIEKLLRHQGPDGYIGIYKEGCRFKSGRRDGEFWTQSRIMLAMLSFYRNTGDGCVLDSLKRLCRCILENTGGDFDYYAVPDEDGSKSHGLMIIEPMLEIFRLTGDPRLKEFCVRLYKDYSAVSPGFPSGDLRLGVITDPDIPLLGHGPHVCEMLRIPLLLYRDTQRAEYLEAFRSGMVKLRKNLMLSGSCKSDELVGNFASEADAKQEKWGNLCGSLPLPEAGYEYCSTTELAFTFHGAYAITGDSAYLDMEEWLVCNAAMAARQSDGKAIEYLCADNLYAASREVGTRWDYSPTHTDTALCCAPNSGRILPFHLSGAVSYSDGTVSVDLLMPFSWERDRCEKDRLKITQKADYPFTESLEFQIECGAAFTLRIRRPGWAKGADVRVDGAPSVPASDGGFIGIAIGTPGCHSVEIAFAAIPEVLRAPDGTAAFRYGPLLYSLRIREKADPYASYPSADFHDIDYVPEEGQSWSYSVKDEVVRTLSGISVLETGNPSSGQGYGWDAPCRILRVPLTGEDGSTAEAELVPIGNTILRRTAFPVLRG